MSSEPPQVPAALVPSHLDRLLPIQEEHYLAKTTLLLLVRALALGREALCLVAPRPLPLQQHLQGLAFVKPLVSGLVILVLCLVRQPVAVDQSLASSHPLPVAACLGLEMLQEGAVSSVALEENPARMLPTKTHSAQPVGALDLQLHQIPPICLETVELRPLEGLAAHPSGSRSLLAPSALVVAAWHPKVLDFPLQIKQVASVLLQCLAALLLLGDPLGLEGCQHSVQPQPLQALWARREAKCSERVLRPPAQEDSGLGAAATLRPSVPSPVRTRPLLDPCPSRPLASGPRAVDSLGLDQAQEHSPLDRLTRLSRALVAGEAEPTSAFPEVPVSSCTQPSTLPAPTGTDCQKNFLMKMLSQEETLETKAQQCLTACLFPPFRFYIKFSSAIKVFGLVLHRTSVGLFRSQPEKFLWLGEAKPRGSAQWHSE